MRVPVPALLLPLFLAGCALPPVISVASLALSGASYATTGKSTSDHALSAIVGEDCALHRAVGDDDICDPNGEVLFKADTTESASANLYLDPEIGLTSADSLDYTGPASDLQAAIDPASQLLPDSSDVSATSAMPGSANDASAAPAQSSLVDSDGKKPLANLLALATDAEPRGNFANARPTPKPATPQVLAPQIQEPKIQEQQVQELPTRDQSSSWIVPSTL